MLLALLLDDGSKLGYHVNPQNVVGAFYDALEDGYYVDMANGNQLKISENSYMRILWWMDRNEQS